MSSKDFYADALRGRSRASIWVLGAFILVALTKYSDAIGALILEGISFALNRGPGMSIIKSLQSVGQWQNIGSNLFYILLGAIGLWYVQKTLRRRPLQNLLTASSRFRWRRLLFSIFCFWGLMGIAWAIYLIAKTVLYQPSLLEQLGASKDNGFGPAYFSRQFSWTVLFVSLLFYPALIVIQEMIFRGYLDQGLRRFVPSKLGAFVLSSIIFAMWSQSYFDSSAYTYITLLHLAFWGFCMSVLTDLDQGLEAAIGFFIANDLFYKFWFMPVAYHLYSEDSFGVIPASVGLVFDAVFLIVFLVIMSRFKTGLSSTTKTVHD